MNPLKTKILKRMSMLTLIVTLILPAHSNAATSTFQTVQFKDGTSQSQSKSIILPDNSFVKSVNSDNGNVSYTKSGNTLTLNVSGGAVSRTTNDPYKYSKSVADYQSSYSNYFDNTLSYNSGGYTGTLSKNGGSYVSSGSYTPGESKTINDSRSTSQGGDSSSLPSSIYYNDGTFSGYLNSSNSPYVSSGSYTAEMNRTQTDTRSTSVPGESSSNTPAQVYYNAGGFSGWLNKNGSPTVKSGTAPDSKTVSDYLEDIQRDSTNPFPNSMSYNSGGYSGNLSKSGTPSVRDSAYYISGTTQMTQINDDGRVAPPPSNSGPGRGVWQMEADSYAHFVRFKTTGGSLLSGYFKSGSVNIDRWTRAWYSGSLPGCGAINGKTKSYEEVVNCATNVNDASAYGGTPINHHDTFYRWYWSLLRQTYSGTVTRPDTRLWNQDYSGTVTRPASDTRVWTRNYSGTVSKPSSDNRIYRQDYTGTVYKPEIVDYYDYNVTVEYVIDTEAPNGDLSQTPTAWTKDSVDLILSNIKDDTNGSGFKQVRLPNGNILNSTNPITYNVTGNGTYSFELEDNNGNKRIKTITVSNIDKTAPTGTVTQTPLTPTSGDVTLNLTGVSDVGSGVKNITLPNGTIVTTATASQVVTANGTYTFSIEDNAGNVTSKTITVSNVDKTPPTGTVTQTPLTPTNGDVTLNLTGVSDVGSGVKNITLPNGTIVTTATASQVVTANGTYTFSIEDNVGNVTSKTITVSNIDKSSPTADLTQTPTVWTNGNVTLNLTGVSDVGSGVKNITLPNGTVVTTTTASQVVTANGTYTFRIEDNTGNVTTKTIIVTNIDKVAPTANLNQNTTMWTNGTVLLNLTSIADSGGSGIDSIKLPDGTFVTGTSASYAVSLNGTYSFEIYDTAGNKTVKTISVNNVDKVLPTALTSQNPTSWTNGVVQVTLSGISDSASGIKQIEKPDGSIVTSATSVIYNATTSGDYTFKVTDNAGNTNTFTHRVSNIDKILPTASLNPNGVAWKNSSQSVVITPSDTGDSNVKSWRYRTSSNNGSTYGAWSALIATASDSVNLTGHATYRIQVEVTDNAGNTQIVTSNPYQLDMVKPSITATPSTTSPTNANVTVSVNASDSDSGIARIKLPDGTIVSASTSSYVVSTNGTYTFEATDVAGNTATTVLTVSNIDKEKPTATLTQTPSSWTNGNVTLNLTGVSDTGGSGLKTTGNIKLPNGTFVTGTSASQVVTANGTYTFLVYDNVGNSENFTLTVSNIDKIKPTGSIQLIPGASALTIQFNGTDAGSGVDSITLPNGVKVVGATANYATTTIGTYTATVLDRVGNSETVSVTINEPNATLQQEVTDWTNRKDYKLIVNGTPQYGSTLRIQAPFVSSTWTDTNRLETTITKNGRYTFVVNDGGIFKTLDVDVTNFDRVRPLVDIQEKNKTTNSTTANVRIIERGDVK